MQSKYFRFENHAAVFFLIHVLIEPFFLEPGHQFCLLKPHWARFCLRPTWDTMKNPVPATVLCDVEAQHSFQQQCWGKLLGEVSPFFPHGNVFTVPSPRKFCSGFSGSAFPQICNASPALLCFVQNGQFCLFFWWKYLPGFDEQGWNFQRWTLQCCRASAWALRGSKLWPVHREYPFRMLHQKERAGVFWGNRKDICLTPSNGVSILKWANNELLRTFKLKKKCRQCLACFCGKLCSLGSLREFRFLPQTMFKKYWLWSHFYLIDAVCYFMYLNYSKITIGIGFTIAFHNNKCNFKQVYFAKKIHLI